MDSKVILFSDGFGFLNKVSIMQRMMKIDGIQRYMTMNAFLYLVIVLLGSLFGTWLFAIPEYAVVYFCGLLGLFLWILFLTRHHISLSWYDGLLMLICLYNLSGIYLHNRLLETLLLVNLYIASRILSTYKSFYPRLLCLLCVLGCLHAFIAIFQFFHWIELENPLFRVSGIFKNPAPLGGYMALCFVATSSYLSKYRSCIISKLIISCALMLQGAVLFLSDSRAAWLATLIALFYLLAERFRWKRLVALGVGGFLAVCFLFCAFYIYKPASAKGRLMVWKVCVDMIKERPLWGSGFATFPEQYMPSQACYIMEHPEEDISYFTTNNSYAFNEFIHIVCEQGCIGLLLVLVIIGLLFYWNGRERNVHPLFPCFLAFLIFSCSSYPCSILPLFLLLAVILGCLGSQMPFRQYKLSGWQVYTLCFFLMGAFTFFSWNFVRRYNAEKALSDYYYEEKEDALSIIDENYPHLQNTKDFIFRYAESLYLKENYERCIPVLHQAIKLYPSTEKYMDLGECYQQIGDMKNAEACYKQASGMLPCLVYPSYCLLLLYEESGRKSEAIVQARKIVQTNPPVLNAQVKRIQQYAMNYLKTVN